MKEAIPFLIETALLTHGVTAISNEELLKCLPPEFPLLVWVDKGKIILEETLTLSFRDRAAELIRIDESKLEEACAKA